MLYHIAIYHILLLCLDINECEVNNGGCSHNCTNTEGSFKCSCRVDYELHSDGYNCTLGTL